MKTAQQTIPKTAAPNPVSQSNSYIPVCLPSVIALNRPLVAAGADLKNVPAFAEGQQFFFSQPVGNLDDLTNREEQVKAVAKLEWYFNNRPQTIVCDMHPDYASSRYARERAAKEGLTLIEVQHHHAHIAGCLAENDYTGPAIGLAFDGTGYGTDGRIWGGEILLSSLGEFERLYHLEYLPLPGGDAAIKRPYRAAIAYLLTLCPHVDVTTLFPLLPAHEFGVIEAMVEQNLNCPATSSLGRLFDVVSAMLGVCQRVNYEAQAAIELEAAAWQSNVNGRYYFCLEENEIKLGRLLYQIAADRLSGAPVYNIARRFHNTLAAMSSFVAEKIRSERGQNLPVALSGGVWQNRLLLELTVTQLREAGFDVLLHRQVPTHDGGLAYGQTAVAAARLKEKLCA